MNYTADLGQSNECSPSPRWEWQKVKLKPPPGQGSQPAEGRPLWRDLRRRNRNRKIWVELSYRGGAESSWIVTARGVTRRFPGYWSIEEVGAWINAE